MKRFIYALSIVSLILMAMPAQLSGQAKIVTKKEKISDFTQKTTKVVLTGNELADACLMSEVSSHWTLSPFEFCSADEFKTLCKNPSYYFLLIVKGQTRKEAEAGIEFLTLVKGGEEAADGNINAMLEVITLPFRASGTLSGREETFLPALLAAMQTYVDAATKEELTAMAGINWFNNSNKSLKTKTIVFSKEDLSTEVSESMMKRDMKIVEEDEADDMFDNGEPGTAISYTVAPTEATVFSYCYKYLIDPANYNIYYLRKSKITAKAGPGFLAEDIKKIGAFKPAK